MNGNGFHSRRTAGFEPHAGGTALGGPSGNDDDGTIGIPYGGNVDVNAHVHESSKDDHSINIKDKNVYVPPEFAGPPVGPGAGPFDTPSFGPGAGPFGKRSWGQGGTAMGGPSGNDEGQSFNMPITANIKTDVNEYNKDDHSIGIKNKNIHPAPVIEHFAPPPYAHGGPPPAGGPPSHPPFRGVEGEAPSKHFHIAATEFGKRFGPAPGGTALGGPGGGDEPDFPGPFVSGGTALGGPSGDDDGLNFGKPNVAHISSHVDEHSKDDHSIDIKHKDIGLPPPVGFAHPGFGAPFKRGFFPTQGATVEGGPSGNDGGQSFDEPITVSTSAEVNEVHKDDHSIKLKHEDITPPPFEAFAGPGPALAGAGRPFRRAYAPDAPQRQAGAPSGGTALGGPSGDDGGINFDTGADVDVDSNVQENHQDNHAIKIDDTHVHPAYTAYEVHTVPQYHWWTYEQQQQAAAPPVPVQEHPIYAASQPEVHEEHSAPPREEHHEQCSAEVREVFRTVTKTEYKEITPTTTVYKHPLVSETVQTSAAVPALKVEPKVHSMVYASVPASTVSHVYLRPEGTSAVYSMIPVHVPQVTPVSSSMDPMVSNGIMMSMATPVSNGPMVSMATPVSNSPNLRPSGASPEQSNAPNASPSSNALFMGAGARVSGGMYSAAAAVMGVLAFVL